MKFLSLLLLLFLTGCGDRYSLDEKRGPDPQGFVTTHPLSLPPDYMLRAPEPAPQANVSETPSKTDETDQQNAAEPSEKPQQKTEE
ncbi:MAG: hypothetical protein IJ752_05100 [Alphaproteobacteria bacterium]|nr:hypothetical protein [Alphaproteobacteria bacterium]